MAQVSPSAAELAPAVQAVIDWRETYNNGVASTFKRQLVMQLVGIATDDPRMSAPFDPDASYTEFGARGIEVAWVAFDNALNSGTFPWASEPDTNDAHIRGLVIDLVDMVLHDLRNETEPTTVWGIAWASYDFTWTDVNENWVGDSTEPPFNTLSPVLSGSEEGGTWTFTVTNGTWGGASPITYTYQWFRNGELVAGENTNELDVDEIPLQDQVVYARVTATNTVGAHHANSNHEVVPGIPVPVNTVAPVITGDPEVGQTLATTGGTWTGDPVLAFQWLADDEEIEGADSDDFTLTGSEEGAMISVRVTATNAAGETVVTSAAVGPVTND